ncbi:MFS transporter [Jeotgalibacillus terrae]|uniref:MFS transporter n=1 Tax=Jeotgalibacillus terrae TaxID=587735 RepID=A0ABW5ZH71_9BACL|nr:MFS transporter [Jeotgalibacillus terrae]MBM7578702.1 MFS family permease [Jeotgalibacillus terrae]
MNKSAFLLLSSIGITSIGSWIYFIALNLMIFNETGSAAAVGLLYIIRPAAALLTSFWCGSLVDRVQKKRLMFWLTLLQSVLVTGIGILSDTLWVSYLFVFLLQMCSSILQPAGMSFTALLIPGDKLHRFNAIRSLLDSGAFLVGPAIAGLLLMNGSAVTAIFINSVALAGSAMLISAISFKENTDSFETQEKSFSIKTDLMADWKSTLQFRKTDRQMWVVYFLFTLFIVLQTAVDSLEVAFSKDALLMTDTQYGLLVSCAGAGMIIGAAINVAGTAKWSTSILIGAGSIMTASGYLIFAASPHFLIACAGVSLLGAALAFANTGFLTLIQKRVPVEYMGRITSFFHFIESLLVITVTAFFAWSASQFPIRLTVLTGVFLMVMITGYLSFRLLKEKRTRDIRYGHTTL